MSSYKDVFRHQPHDFTASLAMSHSASDWTGWESLYRSYFPNLVGLHEHRQDGHHQRAGIDRSLVLDNGKVLYIDEKVRGRNKYTGVVYEDILLEYLSDRDRKAPGWVCKPLQADYIAYLIAPLGLCYLLPVLQLQLAWTRHGSGWMERYPICQAINSRWTTMNVAVPVDVLYPAIGGCLRAQFDPWEVVDG
jgi:hypothetical protein